MLIFLGFFWISRKVIFCCIFYISFVCFYEFFVIVKRFVGIVLEFIRFMEDVIFVEGKLVIFECEVKGELLLVIEWFRDGE